LERFRLPIEPVFSKQFDGVLRADGPIAAEHGIDGAIFVTAPADTLGVFGVGRDLFGHTRSRREPWRVQGAGWGSVARIRVVAPHSSSRL